MQRSDDLVRDGRRCSRRLLAAAATVMTAAAMLAGVPPAAAAAAAAYQPGHAQKETPVRGYSATTTAPVPARSAAAATAAPFRGAAPVWPAAKLVDVDLPSAGLRALGRGAPAAVPGRPVTVDPQDAPDAPLARVRVQSFDHASARMAGVDGVLFRLSRQDGRAAPGTARVSVNYSAFRFAYGADWALRLRMLVLPDCALTTPSLAGCAGSWLATDNDARAATATATVAVRPETSTGASGSPSATTGGTLLALAAAPSGSAGSYKATSLSQSGTWSVNDNSGNFSWSYPLRVPPPVGGPAPTISLDYSSSGVDGRMASTNNQPSWIGEGFEWQPGSVERSYKSCADDMGTGANNTTKTGDLCWETDNATLSFSGHAGELIKDATDPNLWHLRHDDGTRVQRLTGAGNGARNGEYWVATTTDGTQYWFGGRSDSNATLTQPVFGNDANEPCHQTAFKDSSCTQAYRWQLDKVVDTHGNTMTFNYLKETNRYGRNNTTSDAVQYDRGGYLQRIDYGTRTDSTATAPMQVVFDVADRCVSGDCTIKDATHWPDVPWDQECTASPCKDTQTSPTFWTTKRLSKITTRVWDAVAAKYRDVESWTLSHSFPDPTDSITGALWLDKISHSGLAGTAVTVPDVTLTGTVLSNRVDTNNDQYPAMNKFRMQTITSEAGGKVNVSYMPADCVKGTRMPDQTALQNNTLRCYPVRWTPSGYTDPINDFFHKYPVSEVTENDTTGGNVRTLTHYDYLGNPAWHYTDDDGLVKAENKTWSVWRGFPTVRVTKGDPGEQTRTETRYFQGMNGDHLPSGTRSVTLPAITTGNVPAAPDEDAYSGMVREEIVYNGPSGAEVSATVNEPWQSDPTATRTINGSTVTARFANIVATHTRTARDGGRAPRTTTVRTTFDGTYGMPTQVDDGGDDAVSDDQRCTLTDYARNTSAWIVATASRERAFAVDCATAKAGGLTDDDVISDELTSYDNQANGVAPTKGEVTLTEALKAYNAGSPTYLTTSTAAFDAQGRVVRKTDIRGNATTTAYTPATGGPLTQTVETGPLGWTTTALLDPAFGVTTSTTDTNGRKIEMAYDGLGRLTSVWFAGRDRPSHPQEPSLSYSYLVRNNAPVVVTNKRLNADGGYITSYDLYDSLLRARQTQAADSALGTGAVVTDTYHDSAGRISKKHQSYLAADATGKPVAPSTNLFVATGTIPAQIVTTFDGAGRETAAIFQVDAAPNSPGGTEKWRTSTGYGGDRTDVTPPSGDTATSTITDARGQNVELRQYHAGVAPGFGVAASGYDSTGYTYDRKGQLTKVTDPAGNHWDYYFDIRGRQIKVVDPDKGTTTTSYNDPGDVITSTDGNGATIAYTYDTIGRKTTLRDGSTTGPKRAEWIYDSLSNGTTTNGQLTKSIRYQGSDQYSAEYVGFTVDYHPTSVKYTIPTTETGIGGTYSYVYTFNQNGSAATTRIPATGDLGIETLTYGYDALGQATTLSTSLGSTLVTGTEYTSFGELGAVHLQYNAGSKADITRTYETDTRRLAQIWTTRQTSPTTVADIRYSHDPAGNITKIDDVTAGDHQCFKVDYLRRLTDAWTPANGDCTVAASTGALATGAGAYWQTFSYDALGNRTRQVEHATSSGVRTTDYTVPAGGHRLTATAATDNTGTRNASYGYDPAGNTTSRPGPNGQQDMKWDPEGHLASSTDTKGTTSYLYDANGNRLISRDPTGTTLYLPDQELRYTTGTATRTCTRYYTHADNVVAMRTGTGVTWISNDNHGTSQITIAAVGQAVAIRRQTPFGEIRSTTGTWPSALTRGFVGGTVDNTGLTHLGAREYDPKIGRFVSVDPVVDSGDPQQMHGYAYGNNDPIDFVDADGRWSLSGFVKKAKESVAHVVTEAAKRVYNNAGMISTVLGAAAMVCTVVPPLQVAAPFLGAASAAFGALDTYKSCSEGKALDCGLGIAGMIPGARALRFVGKGLNGVAKVKKGLREVEEGITAYQRGSDPKWLGSLKKERGKLRLQYNRRWETANFEDPMRVMNIGGNILTAENYAYLKCQELGACGQDRQSDIGAPRWWNNNFECPWTNRRPARVGDDDYDVPASHSYATTTSGSSGSDRSATTWGASATTSHGNGGRAIFI